MRKQGESFELSATDLVGYLNCRQLSTLERAVPAWVKQTRNEHGSFNISSMPALEDGGKVLAFLGDDDGLAEMRRVVDAARELAPWLEMMARHENDRRLFASILAAVKTTPGCLQTDLKGLLGEADGHRVGVLVSFCERAGKISRIRSGRSYKLMPAALAAVAEAPPKRSVPPHNRDRTPPRLREIDISKLAYVPLPRWPLRWEAARPSFRYKGVSVGIVGTLADREGLGV